MFKPALAPRLLPLLVAAAVLPTVARAEDPAPLMTVVVEGTPPLMAGVDASDTEHGVPGDAAALLSQIPGAAVVRNGAQTGIVQLRGLFNDRVRVRVDGMNITPACPNHMDPPLHYAGLETLDVLDVLVGAAPVSQGGDSLVGSVEARTRAPQFADSAAWKPLAHVELGYTSANAGRQAAVEIGAARDVLNLRYSGGYQHAGDYASARGEVADTGYTNERHALAAAYRHGSGVWEVEAGTHRARDVGTPTLPMDMVNDDADRVRLAFRGATPLGDVEAGVYRHVIDHLMDNFSLRPASGMRMQAPSTSVDSGFTLGLANPVAGGTLKLGAEFHANELDVYQQNLSAGGLRQDTFRGATRDRYGVYGEWEGRVAPRWRMNAGLRGDVVRTDTGDLVDVFGANAAAAAAFNAQDHARSESHLDATLAASYARQRGVSLEGALTRRTRSPSLLERYLWTPQSASAGQADGRTYLGNLDLDPEVAHGVDVGVKLKRPGVRAAASVFWQQVTDFIQGQPIATLDGNGLPVLRYTNVNARLWGGEASLARQFGKVELGTWVSLTRGENTDNGDALYRIAPLRGGVSADYRQERWHVGGEWALSARKDDVATYNGEAETPGYGVLNLRAGYTPTKKLNVTAGVDNVFDKLYYDPLAGVNRVAGGSVPVGGIMPATGRALYVKMDWTY